MEQQPAETRPIDKLHAYQQRQAKTFYDNIKDGTAPPFFYWQDPDTPMPQIGGEPRGISGYCFEADNALQLAMASKDRGYQNPVWLTFDQAKAIGGSVRKNQLGTKMLQWDKKVEGEFKKRRPITVFNGDQISGVDWPHHKALTTEQQATRQAGLDALLPTRKKTPTPQQYNDRLNEVMLERFPMGENAEANAKMTLRREMAVMVAQARLGLPRQFNADLAQDLKPYIEARPHPKEVERAMKEAYAAVEAVGIQPLVYENIPRKSIERPVPPADEPKAVRERAKTKSQAKAKAKEQGSDIPF